MPNLNLNGFAISCCVNPVKNKGITNMSAFSFLQNHWLTFRKNRTEKTDDAQVPVIRLGYLANLTHAQAVIGVDSGSFAAAVAPARLETRVFTAGPALLTALNLGKIDVAYVGPSPALNSWAKHKGRNLVVVAGAAANGVSIIASANSGIRVTEQLKGRSIGVPLKDNGQDLAARWFLEKELRQTTPLQVIPVPIRKQAEQLRNGELDAVWAAEPWATHILQESGGHIVAEEKDLWPGGQFSQAVVIVTPRFLAANRDLVQKLIAEHERLTQVLQRQAPSQAIVIASALGRLSGSTLSISSVLEALTRVQFTTDPLVETWKALAQRRQVLGQETEKINLTGLVDATLLKEPVYQPETALDPASGLEVP